MSLIDKTKVDFQILDSKDPKYLNIIDYSVWGQLEDKTTIVEVTVPGEETPRVHYFKQGQLNVMTSVNLGLTCIDECGEVELVDLPDGIYTITVKGSPDSYNKTRKYLRTELTELDLDIIFINSNLLCKNKDVDVINLITDIKFLLDASAANVRYDNICEAQELLFKAQDLIEKAKNCSGCVDV